MRPINVLFMQSQSYFGADSLIHSLIMRELDRSRVQVHVACNAGTAAEKSAALEELRRIEGLEIFPVDFGPSVNSRAPLDLARDLLGVPHALKSLSGLVAYAQRRRIDIVHGTEKPRDALYGYLLARAVGARAITHMHVKIEGWISPMARWAMQHDDALIGVSEFVAQSAIAFGYRPERVHYALNALAAEKWNAGTDGAAVRRELGIALDMPVIAVCSRLFPWKGHTELLHALARVRQHMSNFKLVVVGEDDPRATPGGGSYSAALRGLRDELGLEENVLFTGFRSDVDRVLAASDIFAMPSFEEPFGLVYLEAMAMRKPIIALDNGGAREVVENGRSGLLSAPKDIETLASNIIKLLEAPQLRREMGQYGRSRVESYYTPQRLARDIEQIYRKVMDQP